MPHNVFSKYKLILGGTLVTCKAKPVYIELNLDTKQYHEKPYPVPRAHQPIFKK